MKAKTWMLLLVSGLTGIIPGQAQQSDDAGDMNKARIQIYDNNNGSISKTDTEISFSNVPELLELLEIHGIDLQKELEQTVEGQTFELIIRRRNNTGDNLMYTMPETFSVPAFPLNFYPPCNVPVETRAFLGVVCDEINEGYKIREIVKESAAEKAGLLPGDIITAVNGTAVNNNHSIQRAISSYHAGDQVIIAYTRNGTHGEIMTELGQRAWEWNFGHMNFQIPDHFFAPDSLPFLNELPPLPGVQPKLLGVYVNQEDIPEKGVRLQSIIPGTCAQQMGLQQGDIILQCNGLMTNNYETLKNAVNSASDNTHHVLLLRDDREVTLSCRMEKNDQAPGNPPASQERLSPADTTIIRSEMMTPEKKPEKTIEKEIRIKVDKPKKTVPAEKKAPEKDKLEIYPNPNNGQFKYKFHIPGNGDANIKVMDTRGSVIYSGRAYGNEITEGSLQLQGIAPGTYFMEVVKDGKALRKTFVMNH